MLKELTVYKFDVNLKFDSGRVDFVPFKVIGKNIHSAKQKLLEWLATTGHQESGYKYQECVGIVELMSSTVLVDTDDILNLLEGGK